MSGSDDRCRRRRPSVRLSVVSGRINGLTDVSAPSSSVGVGVCVFVSSHLPRCCFAGNAGPTMASAAAPLAQ